jgi:tetratricopeptide (TPR) repeat protein
MSKNINKLLLLLLFIMLIQWSCAPTKNTFFRRNYHNVTSHYNAYFNGNESLKEGIAQLEKAHVDDYTGILEIYKYGDESQSQSVFPQMDRSLIKASKVIKKHSMEFKGIEYCEWIDDSYLMIGKAYFFKQDFRLANKTFDFVLRKYGKSEIKAEALLWMIKTNNRKEDYASSSSLIGMLKNEIEQGNAYKKTIKEYPMLCADYYIKTEDYTSAIKSLEEAIKLNKKKKTKTRLLFILGQVYQEIEELQKASDIYKKVVKLNPEYDMAFHAKINMAKCFDAESGDSKTIRKELHKMIKDTKNKDYLDEIYYALAEISIKEEKEEEAIDFLRLSTQKSLNNNKQKGMSYLNLGEIFYSRLEYEYAQMYYDSCVLFLPEEYENYAQIKSKQEILSNLVLNLNTIELEDSLQYLAGLTEAEQNKIIDEIIQELIEEEERIKQEELNNYMNLQNVQTNTQGLGGNQWYFYNTSAMSFGLTEFVKKWGQRKLEDMWRISEKQSAGFGDDNFGDEVVEGDTSGVDTNRVSTDPKDRKTYKQNIPKTEEDIDASNIKIVDAYYAVGIIYKDKLKDLEKSIETFETLLKRFPKNKYQLETYYQLYRVFLDLDYVDKREKYKALILNNYPNSDYAKLILDPDYYKNQEKELDLAEEQYKITYNLYQQESYKEVITQSEKAIIDFHTTDTEAKFAYIRALSIGKTTGADSLVAELEIVVKNYGETEIAVEAQAIIDFYKKSTTAENDQASDDNEADKQTYSFNPNEMHIFVMVLYVEGIKVSDIKIIFSDHNKKYFQITKLTTSSLYLDNTRQMITVSKFENLEEGIKYYKTISQNELLLKSISTAKAKYFIISTINYKLLYQKKDVEEYEEFFNKNYM